MLFSLLVFHCLAFTIYPQRWKGLYLPLFPIKATLNLRHSAVSIWNFFFLHKPFTRPLQAMVCQNLSNFSSLLQRSLAGMKKAPPSHHPITQTPDGGQSLLSVDSKAAGREKGRLGGNGGRNQFFYAPEVFFLGCTASLPSGNFFSLDEIDDRMSNATH